DRAMRHPEPVHHLRPYRGAHSRGAGPHVDDRDAEPLAEEVLRHHPADDPLGGELLVPHPGPGFALGGTRAHAKNFPLSRAIRRSSALGRYRSSPYSAWSAVSRSNAHDVPSASDHSSSPRG